MLQNFNSLRLLARVLICVSLMSLLTACLRGDDDGGNRPPPSNPTPAPTPPQPPTESEIKAFETGEYRRGGGLARINAAQAYATNVPGGTLGGDGVRVGVIDDGIADISDLNVVGRFQFSEGDPDRTHGTPVAGIIAARKNDQGVHGVAFNADLVDLNSGIGGEQISTIAAAAALRAAAGLDPSRPNATADVVNMSFGGSESPTLLNAMIDAAHAGVMMAIATGNDGGGDPNFPARYVIDPRVGGLGIAVGALDPRDTSNNPRASFSNGRSSNACGVAKEFCLFAPGIAVGTTSVDGDIIRFDGTSAAAPYVAGALAVAKGAFPNRSSRQIVERILTTADDLGVPGVDIIYGHGALNLGTALSPVGELSVAVSSGQTYSEAEVASIGSLRMSSAFNLAGAAGAFKNVLAYDSQRFPFFTDLSGNVSAARQSAHIAGFVDTSKSSGKPQSTVKLNLFGFDSEVSLGFSSSKSASLGSAVDAQGMIAPAEMPIAFTEVASPVDSTFASRSSAGFSFALSANVTASLSVQSNQFDSAAGAAETVAALGYYEGDTANLPGTKKTFSRVGLSYQLEGATLRFSIGLLNEKDGLLNLTGTGALQFADSATSTFNEVGLNVPVTSQLSLFATYTHGWLDANQNANSLWRSSSNLAANAFSIGFNYDGLLTSHDRFTFVVGQPLRVASGSAVLALPTGETEDGRVIITERRIDLTPTGQETIFQFGHGVALSQATSLGLAAYIRLEPGHDRDADSDLGIVLKGKVRY